MTTSYNLNRFVEAQQNTYHIALSEIKQGKKQSHWMWFIFPQVKGLGFTDYNIYYAIQDIDEAKAYYQHPILGSNLIEITEELLKIEKKTALEIFGKPDERKLKSCMTLFARIKNSNPIFQVVLNKFFDGLQDERTIDILNIKKK